MSVPHKYPNTIQVGDLVKYKHGDAEYHVRLIHKYGDKCDIVRNNSYLCEYDKIPISKLEVVKKNDKLLSHKQIADFTMSKEYRDKTNPHKKVANYMPTSKTKTEKQLDYLVTVYEPITSLNEKADVNDKVYSRKVITGKEALGTYILELDDLTVKHQREVRVLGRNVKIDIKKEVVIK